MEYLIALTAAALLAIGFPQWEPGRRSPDDSTRARIFCITGTLAHLGGAALVALSGGPLAGIVAFLGIPVGGAVIYSLLIAPVTRERRLRARGPLIGVAPPRAARGR
jgi:hypothetical protein